MSREFLSAKAAIEKCGVILCLFAPAMEQSGGKSTESRLQDFADWCANHITGDEKGEAQIFLDRLFHGFGQKGYFDVGGRIRKASEDGGGTSFADYVWKPIVLIEMKNRGADLSKHYGRRLIIGFASLRIARDA